MVAIKGLEIPSCCAKCDFKEDYCFYCNKLQKGIPQSNFFDSRLPDCPLVEIEERKVGKWIYDKTSQNWRYSECNETPKTLGYVGTSAFMKEHFEFCNHCGAEMKGTEDE